MRVSGIDIMSLPPKNSTQNAIAAAVCAAIVVVACVPIAAFLASFGGTYSQRALIYCGVLLWGVLGAIVLFSLTWKNSCKKITISLLGKWSLSAFLWPLLLIAHCVAKRKHKDPDWRK